MSVSHKRKSALLTSPILWAGLLLVMFLGASITLDAQAKGKAAKKTSVHDRGSKLTSPAYIEATKTYAASKYADALEQFQALDRNGMCCDMVHYYMALCCQHQNQMARAVQNYEYVIAYSRDPRLKYYAQAATAQLGYYQNHRTYEGQGNSFVGQRGGGGGRGGGGSAGGGGGGGGGG